MRVHEKWRAQTEKSFRLNYLNRTLFACFKRIFFSTTSFFVVALLCASDTSHIAANRSTVDGTWPKKNPENIWHMRLRFSNCFI